METQVSVLWGMWTITKRSKQLYQKEKSDYDNPGTWICFILTIACCVVWAVCMTHV